MDPVFKTTVILCLSVLFASAAVHKLKNCPLFREQLGAYGLVPEPLIGAVAISLALVELSLAAALLLPYMAVLALYGTALMLALYGLVMALAIGRGRAEIDCGCSGAEGSTSISYGLVIRNLALCTIALVAALPGLQEAPVRDMAWVDLGLAVLAAGTFIAFYQAANQLMANGPHLKIWRTA